MTVQILVYPGQALACVYPRVRYCVVSVTTDLDRLPEIPKPEQWMGTLRLQFADVSDPQDPRAITEELAGKIAGFVTRKIALGAQLVICSCEAGLSRSPGLAAALDKHLNGQDQFWFDYYQPNNLVRRLVLGALQANSETTRS